MLAFTLHFFLLTGVDMRQTMLFMPPFLQALEANLHRASVFVRPNEPRFHSGWDHISTPRHVRWEDLWDLWSRQQGTHDRTGPVSSSSFSWCSLCIVLASSTTLLVVVFLNVFLFPKGVYKQHQRYSTLNILYIFPIPSPTLILQFLFQISNCSHSVFGSGLLLPLRFATCHCRVVLMLLFVLDIEGSGGHSEDVGGNFLGHRALQRWRSLLSEVRKRLGGGFIMF